MSLLENIRRDFKKGYDKKKSRRNFERKVQAEAGKIYEQEYRRVRMETAKKSAKEMAIENVTKRKTKGSGFYKGLGKITKALGTASKSSGGYWDQQVSKGKKKGRTSFF